MSPFLGNLADSFVAQLLGIVTARLGEHPINHDRKAIPKVEVGADVPWVVLYQDEALIEQICYAAFGAATCLQQARVLPPEPDFEIDGIEVPEDASVRCQPCCGEAVFFETGHFFVWTGMPGHGDQFTVNFCPSCGVRCRLS